LNLRSVTLRLGIGCALTGILAASLAAQNANNSNLTNTSTNGIQPVNDLLPLFVWFTGPQNWDFVGSSAGLGGGANGGGNGLLVPVAGAAQAPAVPAWSARGELNRTDLAPAALQQADALIEKYAQPVAAQEPMAEQKFDIDSAIQLLKSDQAPKWQGAMDRLIEIGPAALGELRRLAAAAPPENAIGGNSTADACAATMAAVTIRRIEAAQRQPISQELISLGDATRAVLSLKLAENTAVLLKASPNSTIDSPAAARERAGPAAARAAEKQGLARHDRLVEIRQLLSQAPPVQPPTSPEDQPQLATSPARNAGWGR
jgi:hypothetical protein